jgi:hypothetical protein
MRTEGQSKLEAGGALRGTHSVHDGVVVSRGLVIPARVTGKGRDS